MERTERDHPVGREQGCGKGKVSTSSGTLLGMTKRAAIYTRISKDKVGAGLGVERQRADCQALADSLGWPVVAEHQDNDLSAYSGKRRPGYQALLDDLRTGAADAVLVWHTDRLHRSPVELEAYIEVCEGRGVITQTVKAGPLDLATPSGRMVARTLGGIARYEVEHMIERQQRAKLQAASEGRYKGGRRPYGYESDGMTVRLDEAAEVRKMTDRLLAGANLSQIARDLNGQGVVTSTGSRWNPTEVRSMIRRPRNAGLMEHRAEIVGKAAWPAIVDEPTWRAASALLSDPSRRTQTSSDPRWLGTGLYLCGVCGGTLKASNTGTLRDGVLANVYKCRVASHVVRVCAQVDEVVEAALVARLSRPDLTDLDAAPPVENDVHIERLSLLSRLDELVDLHTSGAITAQQLQRGSTTVRTSLDQLDTRLAASASGRVLAGALGDGAAAAWQTFGVSRRRAILAELATITIQKGKRGRPPGWSPGQPYFDRKTVGVTWRVG